MHADTDRRYDLQPRQRRQHDRIGRRPVAHLRQQRAQPDGDHDEPHRRQHHIDALYAGPNQFERTSVGSTTHNNSALGVSADTTGTTTTGYRRDDSGQLVSLRQGTNTPHYYLLDGLGSIAALSNTSGAKSRSYSYDPYGATTDGGGTSPANPWHYAGAYQDPTGFYKMGARYYAPTLMLWTQQDPLEAPNDVRRLNRYAYVGGNPVNRTDLKGLWFGEDALDAANDAVDNGLDYINENVSFTADEAMDTALGWSSTAGLCTATVAAAGTGVGAGVAVLGASVCASSAAAASYTTARDLRDYP